MNEQYEDQVKVNEKTMTREEFSQYQQQFEGAKDVSIVQTGKDEYRTRIQD